MTLDAPGKVVEPITAMRTSADTGEIRSALLDLGFVDRDGILEGPGDPALEVLSMLEGDAIYASGVGEPSFGGDVVSVVLDLPKPMSPRAFQAEKFAGIFLRLISAP